jgi:hypothetical protein
MDRDKREWELKRHEIEQLYGLRAQLFETAWNLSSDYNFEDKLRLTEKQLTRYSAALLESDPLKRFERLDVMSDKFGALPQFWYYKGNAAMQVFNSKEKYGSFKAEFKGKALDAYKEFHKRNFEFLREDIVAASCCLEHISLLDANDPDTDKLLKQALNYAGENYDVLQQCVLVNLRNKKFDDVINPLREMIANDYNVGFNGELLSEIYLRNAKNIEYEILSSVTGGAKTGKILPNINIKSTNLHIDEKIKMAKDGMNDNRISNVIDEYSEMIIQVISKLNTSTSPAYSKGVSRKFVEVTQLLMASINNGYIKKTFEKVETKLREAAMRSNEKTLRDFKTEADLFLVELQKSSFTNLSADDVETLSKKMKDVIR